jgi:hypothetical protein
VDLQILQRFPDMARHAYAEVLSARPRLDGSAQLRGAPHSNYQVTAIVSDVYRLDKGNLVGS